MGKVVSLLLLYVCCKCDDMFIFPTSILKQKQGSVGNVDNQANT